MSTYLRNFFLVLCFLAFFQGAVCGQTNEPQLLDYDFSGSGKPGASGHEFMSVMAHKEVQKVLLDVANEPRKAAYLEEKLKGTGVTSDDLKTLRLIRREGDKYVLAFSLFTNADLDKIRAVAEVEGRNLAAALLARRSEIENILASNPQLGVDWKARAFIVLGCASLDWDGLDFARKKGYLAVPEKGTYVPIAKQIGGGGSLRGVYWGSHSFHETIALTTFGDNYSLPRNSLNEIFDLIGQMQGPKPLISKLFDATFALGRRRGGMMMLSLRKGEKTLEQLAEASGITDVEARALINLLLELNYISAVDGRYRALIPVFDKGDEPMVKELRRLGRDVIVKWFDEHYVALSKQLSDLAPARCGVPFAEGFWWPWHYIFGLANRELVAAGLFADPYDDSRIFKGFIPTVYILDVLKGSI